MPLTLAADVIQIIVISIGLVIFVGNAIVQALKANTKNTKPSSTSGTQSSGISRLKQLVAKRLAELQELARESQRQAEDRPTSSSKTQPTNLGMGESRQREDAKKLYERRAEALRQMQRPAAAPLQTQHATLPREPVASMPGHDLSKVRERENQLKRQRQNLQRQRAQQERQQAEQLGRNISKVSPTQHGDIQQVHRHVANAPQAPYSTPTHPLPAFGGLTLNRQTMRQAVILKEILDPPLALRPVRV